MPVFLTPIVNLPRRIKEGDDVAGLLAAAVVRSEIALADYDVIVVNIMRSSTIVHGRRFV